LKAQVVIDKKRKKILYVLVGKGREHDFKLFKRANIQFYELSEVLGDRGYQGLQHFHANSQTPQRKPPKQPLSKAAKRANRELASLRITVEHVIRDLKIFRILKETYRNKRRRFGLRLHLIAAICNLTYAR
jgi:DDE superfamily endonuclease